MHGEYNVKFENSFLCCDTKYHGMRVAVFQRNIHYLLDSPKCKNPEDHNITSAAAKTSTLIFLQPVNICF
jgi:hypothetical protein